MGRVVYSSCKNTNDVLTIIVCVICILMIFAVIWSVALHTDTYEAPLYTVYIENGMVYYHCRDKGWYTFLTEDGKTLCLLGYRYMFIEE